MKKLISLIICMVMILTPTVTAFAESGISMPEFQTPALTVQQSHVPTVDAGSENNQLEVEIVNNSFSIAYDVVVTVSPDNCFTVGSEYYIINAGSISPYGKVTLTLPYNVSFNATNGVHNVNFGITCKSGDFFNIQMHSFTGNANIIVNEIEKINAPVISNISFAKKSIIAGETNILSFTVSNPNSTDLYNLTFDIDGIITGATDAEQINNIEVLKAGSSVKVSTEFTTFTETPEGLYDFNITLEAVDAVGETQYASKGAYFTVTKSSEFTEHSPKVIIDSYSLSPTGVQPGKTATLKINLTNLGIFTAENVKVSLGGYDSTQISLREVTSQKNAGNIDMNAKVSVEYSITLSNIFPQDTQVPLILTLTYSDALGNYYTDTANLTIMSVSPKEDIEKPNEEPEPVYKTPKIIIESFTAGKDTISAGEEFELTFVLKNTSEDFDVENITILLQNDSNNIFTPVSASYSYFIEKIPAGETYEISIPLLPKISAESNIYAISFSIDYEYLTKTNGIPAYVQNTVRETLSVKVVQPINIELSNIYIPYTVYEGDIFNISFMYNNKSRSNLYFLNIDLEGDFSFLDGKQEMGSIPSGYSDMFDGMVQVNAPAGEYTFDIVFNFKDAMNKDAQFKYPCTIIVEPAPMWNDDPMMGGDIMIEDPIIDNGFIVDETEDNRIIPIISNTVLFIIIGAVAVSAVIIVVVVVVVKKRKKALNDGADEQ